MIAKPLISGLIVLLTTSALAQDRGYVADAFGVVPAAQFSETEREKWAGVQQVIIPDHSPRMSQSHPKQVDNVLLFVGPKSAVAGTDQVHAVAIGLDRLGNLVGGGEAVSLVVQGHDTMTAQTNFGIADQLFMPETAVGMFHVGASTGQRQSARGEFRVVPDLASVDLQINPRTDVLSQEAFVEFSTYALSDQYDNPVGHGVALALLTAFEDGGYAQTTGITVDDVARFHLLTRAMGLNGVTHTTLGARQSGPATLAIQSFQAPHPPEIQVFGRPSIETLHIRIGPFLTDRGYVLNDGVPVYVAGAQHSGAQFELNGWLRDGYFEALVPGNAQSLPMDISVATQTGDFMLRVEALTPPLASSQRGLE